MKKVVIFIVTLLILLVGVYILVANFSEIETRYKCNGEIVNREGKQAAQVLVKLTEFRWWVGLYSQSEGMMSVEIPKVYLKLFEHLKDVGNKNYAIYDSKIESYTSLQGGFDQGFGRLWLSTDKGHFWGACNKLE